MTGPDDFRTFRWFLRQVIVRAAYGFTEGEDYVLISEWVARGAVGRKDHACMMRDGGWTGESQAMAAPTG